LVKAAYSSAGIRAISSYRRCKLRTSVELLLGLGVGSGLLQKGGGAVVDQQVKAGAAQNLGGLGAAIGAALGRDGLCVKVDDGHGIQVGGQLPFQRTQASL